MRAGTILRAGPGTATILADMDFETYSEAGLAWNPTARRWGSPPGTANKRSISAVGAARYAEHHSTEVLCLKYDLKDGRGRRMWIPGMPDPQDLFDHIAAGGLIEAWNVGFERHIWEKVCVPRLGWPPIPRRQYRCAMAKSRAYGLPGSLSAAAAVTNSIEQKDKDGTRLLNKFSTPRNPTKNDGRLRIRPQDDPADAERLYAYCEQDIVAEAVMSSGTPDLEGEELEYWLADQEINARGVQIDVASVRNCVAVIHATHNRYDHEMSVLTGGVVSAASEIERLKGWIGAQGLLMPSMDEEAVEAALKRDDLNPLARRALEIRSLVGSASVKKLFAMNLQVCADGRLRDLFSYHAARTGRATGNGPQPTNLPNHGPAVRHCGCCKRHYGLTKLLCPWCGADPTLNGTEVEWNPQAVEDCLCAMNTRSLAIVELYFDEAMAALSGCLRGMFVAREGYDLIGSAYSAIEAVVLAELAGEGWRQDVFRTHGKIYEMSASKITGVPFEEFAEHRKRTGQHHPMRKKVGKLAELASGYQGWVGAWKAFGADEFFSDDEIKEAILAWRAASPSIVEFWGGQSRNWKPELFGIEGCVVNAILHPGQTFQHRGISYVMIGDALICRLLSGRPLTYHRPRLTESSRRRGEWSISYEGWNTNPKNGRVGWIRMYTWGGRLVENIVQATARDLQRFAILNQEKAGYPIVLHVYDENVAEVPEGWGSVEEFERLMSLTPDWAAGWPVKAAGGWRGKRDRKD